MKISEPSISLRLTEAHNKSKAVFDCIITHNSSFSVMLLILAIHHNQDWILSINGTLCDIQQDQNHLTLSKFFQWLTQWNKSNSVITSVSGILLSGRQNCWDTLRKITKVLVVLLLDHRCHAKWNSKEGWYLFYYFITINVSDSGPRGTPFKITKYE